MAPLIFSMKLFASLVDGHNSQIYIPSWFILLDLDHVGIETCAQHRLH